MQLGIALRTMTTFKRRLFRSLGEDMARTVGFSTTVRMPEEFITSCLVLIRPKVCWPIYIALACRLTYSTSIASPLLVDPLLIGLRTTFTYNSRLRSHECQNTGTPMNHFIVEFSKTCDAIVTYITNKHPHHKFLFFFFSALR